MDLSNNDLRTLKSFFGLGKKAPNLTQLNLSHNKVWTFCSLFSADAVLCLLWILVVCWNVVFCFDNYPIKLPSVHWHCWLGSRRGIQPVKKWVVWARGQCRISPPRFLAECCKRQLNQVSFVPLYFRLSTFSDLYWVCLSVFSCTVFVCQYQSSDWLWRPPPKWPILCRVGR